MNQARSTYQSDFTPYGWFQNNFLLNKNEFCCSENVDDCLKYISQELCALGYPSIYSDNSECPYAVNCDIVKFLNVTFELLKCHNEYSQIKEDLENRNQRLCSDLNVCSKKSLQLKNGLEQNEKKLNAVLERERQLKEKNEQLLQLLKAEKDETKKLTGQLRQQKLAYQHEIRKYENNMNQIKAKLNQILSDKNPNKKIASISMSHPLPRNTGQRGKWKTGTSATTAYEDMYNAVISNYEIRCKDMCKELKTFHQCLEKVLLQIFEIICSLQDDIDGSICSTTSREFVINDIKSASRNIQTFEDKFKYLLNVWKETASIKDKAIFRDLENECLALKSKVLEYETIPEMNKKSSEADESKVQTTEENIIQNDETEKSLAEEFKREKLKLEEDKLALLKIHENIEKEKAAISAQKVDILRFAMQQKVSSSSSSSSWNQTLNSVPSISVITSKNGESKILSSNQLKSSLSSPDQISLASPLWNSCEKSMANVLCSKSNAILLSENESAESPAISSTVSKFSDSDLPSWALTKSEGQSLVFDEVQNSSLEASYCISNNEIDVQNESSSEEINLLRLKAAVEDIEKRRLNIS